MYLWKVVGQVGQLMAGFKKGGWGVDDVAPSVSAVLAGIQVFVFKPSDVELRNVNFKPPFADVCTAV